jgi:hypothetical protein
MITSNQIAAGARHVATYAAGAVTAAAALHLLSAGDATTLQTSLEHIANGVSEIAVGVGPLIGLASAAYAWLSASLKKQAQSVASTPGTVVVTTPALAAATPEKNIVANTENKVVPK